MKRMRCIYRLNVSNAQVGGADIPDIRSGAAWLQRHHPIQRLRGGPGDHTQPPLQLPDPAVSIGNSFNWLAAAALQLVK